MAEVAEEENEKIPKIVHCALLDGTFFEVISKTEEGILKATCKCCKPTKNTVIRGTSGATSNFLLHLKRLHPDRLEEYEAHKQKIKKQRGESTLNVAVASSIKRKHSMTDVSNTAAFQQSKFFASGQKGLVLTQEQFDHRVTAFVVNGMHSLATVEEKHFIKLFEGFGLKIMSRRTLVRRINVQFAEKLCDIKAGLRDQKYICTTADIWSMKTRSFLGVTAHWIEEGNFQRKSVSLACTRFEGSHTFDRIAELLHDIHAEFGLSTENIVATVTDNGSNFVKAFKEFGVQLMLDTETEDVEDVEIEGEKSEGSRETVLFSSIQASELSEHIIWSLPRHLRCASHTLNLLATTDIKNVIAGCSPLKRVHYPALAKCTALWNASRRPKSSEVIQEVLGHKLSYPCPTRWNSLYDSLVEIVKSREKMADVHDKLASSSILKDFELDYLEEYCMVMKPIANSLDRLQGDKEYSSFYGNLIPTLFAVKKKLFDLVATPLKYCSPLVEGMLSSLQKRFGDFFDLSENINEAIIAACTHPNFKLRWLPTSKATEIKRLQTLVVSAAEKIKSSNVSEVPKEPGLDGADDFFDFQDPECVGDPACGHDYRGAQIDLEVLQFFEDKRRDFEMLNLYPTVKQLFLRSNTSLPSSAAVGRLFSFATMINQPKRSSLTDKLFEKLVVLKGNGYD